MTFPEPPWTQAPSEVMAWRFSVGARPRSRSRSHRPTRVKSYEVRMPAAEDSKLLARMTRLGLGQVTDGRVLLPHLIARLAHREAPEIFLGRIGAVHVRVLVRKRNRLEIRLTLTPQTTFRRSRRLVSQLGLHPAEGTWI